MKKKESYNIYRGFIIKYYPGEQLYRGKYENTSVFHHTLAGIKKEINHLLDGPEKNQFLEEYVLNPMKKRKNSAIRINPKYASGVRVIVDAPDSYTANLIAENLTLKAGTMSQSPYDDNEELSKIKTLPRFRKNISVPITNNPLHFPKTNRGRPRGKGRPKTVKASGVFPKGKGRRSHISWFILDTWGSKGKHTLIGRGSMANAKIEAEKISKKRGITKCELSGPYKSKPDKNTTRK